MRKSLKTKAVFLSLSFSFFTLILFAQNSQNLKPLSACNPPYASAILDINNIETKVFTGGDMHWDLFGTGSAYYRFPKGSNKNSSGAAALWIGGLDGGGQLKIAAQTYRQTGYDFWPGPLDPNTVSTSWENCMDYDRFWKLDYNQINEFIGNYNAGNVAANTYTPSNTILTWPGFDTIGFNYSIKAPHHDKNGDGYYKPKISGDYPNIKGDQQLYCIMNDKGDIHTSTGGSIIGIEIQLSAYAYGCKKTLDQYPELANATFYHYKIINRSNITLRKTHIALWVDGTIGDPKDDYIGSNSGLGYGYCYNADAFDSIYGNILPATATVLLKGPKADPNDGIDNNGDGVIDEIDEEISVPNLYYFYQPSFYGGNSTFIPGTQQTEPTMSSHFYNYMYGYWKDGSPFTCGGNAYGGSVITKNVFPGNSVPIGPCGNNWTEISANNPHYDRNYLLSVGPFSLTAQSTTEFEVAFISSMDSSSVGNPLGSVLKLETDVQKIKNFYKLAIKPSCVDTNAIAKVILPKKSDILLWPNPVEHEVTISFESYYKTPSTVKIYDILGRVLFENVYVNEEFAKIDLTALSKAVYIIEIANDNYTLTRKLFKQ